MKDPWTGCDELLLGRYRDQVLWHGAVVRISPAEMKALRSLVVGKPTTKRVHGVAVPMKTRRLIHHGLFESEDGRGGGVLALPHGDMALDVASDIGAVGRSLALSDVSSRVRRSTRPSRGARSNPVVPACCVRNSDEELRALERAARGGDPEIAARWVAARLRRGEAVSGRELIGLGLATGLREPRFTGSGRRQRQVIDSAHLAFNRQTSSLGTGNRISDTQSSTFVRPWDETVNPVGDPVSPGHLTSFDLNIPDLRSGVREFVEGLAKQGRQTILYKFFVSGRGEERRTLGWVVTSGDRGDEDRLLGVFFGRRDKAQSAVETAMQYVSWEPLAGYFDDHWPPAARYYGEDLW